jgi:tetraacyldisaccharide 4'-kinase
VGGTGKTPHVEFLIKSLINNFKIAVISRGYGRKTNGLIIGNFNSTPMELGDEMCQLITKFNDAILVIACEKRKKAIEYVVKNFPEINLIILDDAFQHRQVHAQYNILLSDYKRIFYKDHILPFGKLRENRNSSKRANVVIVTKCPDGISSNEKKQIEKEIKKYTTSPVFFSSLIYDDPFHLLNPSIKIKLEGNNVILVTGIAEPRYLEEKVKKDAILILSIKYPDHHNFTEYDIIKIKDIYKLNSNCIIISTEKDAVKIKRYNQLIEHLPWYIIPISIYDESLNCIVHDIKKRAST